MSKDMKAITVSVLETIKKMDPDPLPGDGSEAWGEALKHVVLFQAGEIERLQIIVNDHPTTEDGHVITWGDRLWAVTPDTSDEFEADNSWAGWITVRNMEPPHPDDPPRWLIIPVGSIDGCFFNDECYSTKAAVQAAGEK